jgi:6-phosphogluconolactonase
MIGAVPKILLLAAVLGWSGGCKTTEPAVMRIYVGTYTGPKSQGIYVLNMDMRTGELSKPQLAAKTSRPSFVAPDPSGAFLYCVDEVSDMQGKKTGAVRAFSIDQATGKLAQLNYQFSGGMSPCYVGLDHENRNVLVANYASGSVSIIPISNDGKLGEPTGFDQHHGSSVNPKRQEGPHAHFFNVDPTNRYALSIPIRQRQGNDRAERSGVCEGRAGAGAHAFGLVA